MAVCVAGKRPRSRAALERVMGCPFGQMERTWGPLILRATKPYVHLFPTWYAREDVLGMAWEAFWRAALSFDPSSGYDFRLHAFVRVRGHVIDILRCVGGRATSAKAKAGAVPTVSLDMLMESEVEPGQCAPVIHEDVESMLSILTRQEREVVTRTYLHGQTLGECGAWMGFTESRAQQIRKQALNKLKACFGNLGV